MPPRVLVTGASGFIGSHLVDVLQARGASVRAMVRRSSKLAHLEGSKAELVHASLDDVDAMAAAMAGVDVVYHVAGLTTAFGRAEFDRANTEGTANVFAAATRGPGGPRRVVYVSSLMAAGPSHARVARREHHAPTVGYTRYGDSKLGGERIAWAHAGAIEAVIVRPPLVYGPRDTDVLQMIKSAGAGLIAQPGLGQPAWLSAIHALDLVDGILLAGERGAPLPAGDEEHVLAGRGAPHDHVPDHPDHPAGRGIYYFSDGGQHTVTSFGRAAAAALGRRALAVRFPKSAVLTLGAVNQWIGRLRGKAPALSLDKARGSLSPGWWCDSSKAAHALGYRPRYQLAEGLEHTVAWLRDNRWL